MPAGFSAQASQPIVGMAIYKAQRPIDDYTVTPGARINQLRACSIKQPGDPDRGPDAIVAAVESCVRFRHTLQVCYLVNA